MAKLKKWKLPKYKKKYRFHVRTLKKDFLQIRNPIAYNIIMTDDMVEYDTNVAGIKKLKEESFYNNMEIMDAYKNLLRKIIQNHLVTLISILIIFFIFLSSGFFIRDVTFQNPTNYDYDVYSTVLRHVKQRGPFYVLDCKLNDLGNELRTSFPHFAYIGVIKVGAKIIIEIEKQKIPIIDNEDEILPGNIVAKYDGYITGVEVKKGILCVSTSQSVKKGDLLISGNLDYKTDPTSLKNYIRPSGVIIAQVASYEKIKVPKQQFEQKYSGNQHISYAINLFNHAFYLGRKNNIIVGHEIISNIFSLKGVFELYRINSYDVNDVKIYYNEEEALNFAISKIKYDFSLGITTDEEKIVSIDLVLTNDCDDHYEFTFIVKAIRNIGDFQKLSISSN